MRGVNGDCVLTCEEYSPQNETTRVCSCYTTYEEPTISSETIKSCPTNAVQYPYGCYCNKTGLYFDRTLSFSCVATCPNKTFNSSGLCMDCPARCLSCQIDKLYRTYLECMVCEAGFNVIRGQCYKTCSPGQGNSEVNGNCQSCTDPNCLDCSSNVGTCKQCSLLYAASNGACVRTAYSI